jgi:hypothetical protein
MKTITENEQVAKKVLWSRDVKNDVGEQSSINHQLHETRMHPNPSKRYPQYLKEIFQRDYGYDITVGGIPYLATVLKVLVGAGATDRTSTGNKNTTTVNPWSQLENITMAAAGKMKARVSVIARIPEFDTGLNWPTDEEDFIRICMHGEYHAENTSPDIDAIGVGDKIWVNLSGKHTSRPDGKAAGVIVGVFSKPRLEDIVDATPASAVSFRKPCKARRDVSGAKPEYLRGSTESKPNIAVHMISKYKTRIKTGIYGNGTPQTKHHFNAALTLGKNGSYAKSFKGEIKGPTPGKESAFIWVGHLRNNGYLDLLDRPIGLGRETIIYAPMTLDTSSPIEIKYYFHDRAGFGHAWVNGPDTTVEESIGLTDTNGNDFREKIAPAIKDMIKDRRNFILIIPEMAYSRGFSTKSNNFSRTDAMSIGATSPVNSATVNLIGDGVIRNKITSAEARASVVNYLNKLPASEIIINEGFFTDDQVALTNVLQKTRLTERETSTFDGSFTGGLFANFHSEVLSIIQQHLGSQARDNINYTSIIADGMGAINLASLTKYLPNSSTQLAARISFRSISIDRVDYIESSRDMEEVYNFSSNPALTFHEEYNLLKTEQFQQYEFNYITEKGSEHGKGFFDNLGHGDLFDSSVSSVNTKGSRKFSLNAATKVVVDEQNTDFQSVVNMHVVPATDGWDTSKKVGYAFGTINGLKTEIIPFPPFIFDSNPMNTPMNDFVPDHSAKSTSVPSEGMANEYDNERHKLQVKINKFRNVLRAMKGPKICKNPLLKDYCVSGVVSKDGLIKDKFLLHLKYLQDFYRYDILLEHESNIAKIVKDREKLTKYLEDNITKNLKDYKSNNKNEDYLGSIFTSNSFTIQLDEGVELYTMNKAEKRIRKAPWNQIISSNVPGVSFFVGDGDIKPLANDPSGQPTGAYAIIIYNIAREKAYGEIEERIKKAIDAAEPVDSAPFDPECDPSPMSIADIQSRIIMPPNIDSARSSIHGCVDKQIRVPSNYIQLKSMINYPIDVDEWTSSLGSNKHTSRETDINASTPGFATDTFRYKTRGKERPIYRDSPHIWSCIAQNISDAWEAACNMSGYTPFRITSGIKGESEQGGITAYNSGMLVDSFGLAINVDPHITGYSSTGKPVYSVFTGMWTPGFVDVYARELYELGVLYRSPGTISNSPFGLITTGWETNYYDNAYKQGYHYTQNMLEIELAEGHGSLPAIDMPRPETDDDSLDFGHMTVAPTSDTEAGFKMPEWDLQEPEPRPAEDWSGAEDSYTGPIGPGVEEINTDEYDKYMKPAGETPLVPPDSNPVLWLLTFCERSGMKWGNSTFLRKRFRGGETWTTAEQKRIAAIYNINDIVARINAISWTVAAVDKHMHFQYYAGAPVIRWNEIKGS